MFVKIYDIVCCKGETLFKENILLCKDWIFNNKKYKIIKYNKNKLANDLYSTIGIYRSLILDENNKVISFSPVKNLDSNSFMNLYRSNECIAEEYVEGTMINLFYDKNIEKWEIATKTSVGGNVKYFKNQPTFKELFTDIFETLNLNYEDFDKEYVYSFVMQHPENRFVVKIEYKKLYLISIFKIDNEKMIVEEIPRNLYVNFNLSNNIILPFGHYFNSYEELINYYGTGNTNTNIMGIVIKHINGDKCKIRNPNYEHIKHLKGNSPKLQFQYLTLLKNKKINEYLFYYPENKEKFKNYKDDLYKFTDTLFNNYIDCFVKKEKTLVEYPFQYRNHMKSLHDIYINVLIKNENKKYVDKKLVIDYVNNLEPAKLMFSLNYHLRDLKINKTEVNESDMQIIV